MTYRSISRRRCSPEASSGIHGGQQIAIAARRLWPYSSLSGIGSRAKVRNDVGHRDEEKEAKNHRQHGNQAHQLHRDVKMLSNARADAPSPSRAAEYATVFIQIQSSHYLSLQFGCSASRDRFQRLNALAHPLRVIGQLQQPLLLILRQTAVGAAIVVSAAIARPAEQTAQTASAEWREKHAHVYSPYRG